MSVSREATWTCDKCGQKEKSSAIVDHRPIDWHAVGIRPLRSEKWTDVFDLCPLCVEELKAAFRRHLP